MAQHKQNNGSVDEADAAVQQTARTRSPAYPGIGLETAIKRARELYTQEKMNPIPIAIVVKRWGFKEKSSGGLVAIAALKSFGLLKDSGSGKERKLLLTDEARRILLDTRQESHERDKLIKEAALRPKIHNALWKKWGTDLPSDETIQHSLIFEWSFNENIVNDLLKEYKDTIRFAKLEISDTLSTGNGDNEQLVTSDVEVPTPGSPITTKHSLPMKDGMNNDVFTLEEGSATLQWPAQMSRESYDYFKSWLDLVALKAKHAADKYEAGEDLV